MAAISLDQAQKMIEDFSNVYRTKRDKEAYAVGIISAAISFGKTPAETLKTIRNVLEAFDGQNSKSVPKQFELLL